ncbi:MAG: peptide-methionine (S)-S-oxide reductase MsrA [Vicinamibacterales bacterium]
MSAPYSRPLPEPGQALPGRDTPMPIPARHAVTGGPLVPDETGLAHLVVGMGCFWGAERLYWETPGVVSTAVGYAGGTTPNPTYEETCSGLTGHTEVVRVTYDPSVVSLESLLRIFWEGHDPTQGMRQGNDIGTQYRSAIFVPGAAELAVAEASRARYQAELTAHGYGAITTDIALEPPFYFAEGYHQQYLHKNPNGYCGHGGTGVSCPVGLTEVRSKI